MTPVKIRWICLAGAAGALVIQDWTYRRAVAHFDRRLDALAGAVARAEAAELIRRISRKLTPDAAAND